MSLVRYRPISFMDQLHKDLDRFIEHRCGDDQTTASVADWAPAVDIREDDERFIIDADIPGVDPSNIQITMENGVLTLAGERLAKAGDKSEGYRRVERVAGRFHRRFTLPDTADAEGITARSEHGVLEVSIPKHPRVQPRRINVTVN